MQMLEIPAVQGRVSDAEWQARLELAATYRLVAHFGWTHLINNHISLVVPGTDDQFLINPYGFLYEKITASSLVKIDVNGKKIDSTPYNVNEAGFVIHSAIHMARPDLKCVLHTHTVAGQAISALTCGLLPLNQGSMRFYNRIGYHDFEGIAIELGERERLARDLGEYKAMILKNHGILTAGKNVGEAFHLMYHLEKSCETQMMVLSSNVPYDVPSPEVCEKSAQQFASSGFASGDLDWPALYQLAEDIDPSFKS
jgi:ribulose-5-phosphate 4-epimerase/fuculose-1-phosphate aldolase